MPHVPCAVARCWRVSGAECALWAKPHVLQHERKLPMHRYALSTQLPTGSCLGVCLAFPSQTCFCKSLFFFLFDQHTLFVVMFNSQEIPNRRGYGITVCSFFNEWARNELILQPPWQPKLSLLAASVLGQSVSPACDPTMQHLELASAVSVLQDESACLSLKFSFQFPFGLPQSFKVSRHWEISKKYFGHFCDDSRWLQERMVMSKDESVVCLFLHFLLSEPLSFMGSE